MSVLRESKIEEDVFKWAKRRKIKVCKVQFVETGHPDRLFILQNGLHVWIEFKRPGEVPSRLQYYRIRELQNLGAVATWTDDADDAIKFLETQALSEKSNFTPPVPSFWRIVPRSRVRKDQHRARYISDFEESESGEENADYSSPTSSV